MAMTGRIIGQRLHAERSFFDLKTMPFANPLHKRMVERITCYHCPVSFSEAGMWNAYARHLKTEHR